MRFHLREMLQSLGCTRVQVAGSIPDAQLVLMLERMDVVICDWYMNPASGLDLLREVRSKPALKSTGFIMLTAENTRENVIEALKLGVDDYVVKPISADGFAAKVVKVVARRRAM